MAQFCTTAVFAATLTQTRLETQAAGPLHPHLCWELEQIPWGLLEPRGAAVGRGCSWGGLPWEGVFLSMSRLQNLHQEAQVPEELQLPSSPPVSPACGGPTALASPRTAGTLRGQVVDPTWCWAPGHMKWAPGHMKMLSSSWRSPSRPLFR